VNKTNATEEDFNTSNQALQPQQDFIAESFLTKASCGIFALGNSGRTHVWTAGSYSISDQEIVSFQNDGSLLTESPSFDRAFGISKTNLLMMQRLSLCDQTWITLVALRKLILCPATLL